MVVALNLQYGYAGIPNFGLALSVAGGAYVTGALTGRIAMMVYGVGKGLDFMLDNNQITASLNAILVKDPWGGVAIFLLIVLIAGTLNAGLGFVASYPAIRLKAEYLIMVLIAMAEGIRVIGINYYPLVGGTFWVSVPDLFAWMGSMRTIGLTLIIFAFAIVMFLVAQGMATSPFGRVIKAMRDNEVAAECVGKDVVGLKIRMMVLGAVIASIAGVLNAFQTQAVLSSAYTRTDWTFWPWLMLMVGGRANNIGSAVGASTVITARRLIVFFKHDLQPFIPFSVVWLEQILLGTFLIIVMMVRPQGLIPEKPTRMRGFKPTKTAGRLDKLRKLATGLQRERGKQAPEAPADTGRPTAPVASQEKLSR